MNSIEAKPVISTTEAGRILDKHKKTIVALWRAGQLAGYMDRTVNGRPSALKIYVDSVDAYQHRRESEGELRAAKAGRAV